jgi:signal transduction histidine kinase
VAAAYLVVAAAVAAYATGSLTAQVDGDLANTLAHFQREPFLPTGPMAPPPEDRALGPQRALWLIEPDGSVRTDRPDLQLPAEDQAVTAPTSVVMSGEEIRIAGGALGTGHLIVGQSLAPVNAARTTIILGEALIAPLLLLAVFAGSVIVGRRVAMPVERARQRQLDFTADASHELRTPLSVIEANASLALARERDADWYRGSFARIDDEARRMRRLLDDLLWLARFDAAGPPPTSDAVDLAVLARQTADRFEAVAEARSLDLRIDSTAEVAPVAAPPEWLDRLIGVLLDNACKYAPAGGSVLLAVAEGAGRVTLTVDDSGPGIPEADRELIFDRFHRATDGAQGAGLGLAIADAIVRATGGRWTVGTSPAGGARMSVSWSRVGTGGGRESVAVRSRRSGADSSSSAT